MHKFLIPLVACLLCTTLLHAQVPEEISVTFPFSPNYPNTPANALPCNAAGTFTLGQFIGQSNDVTLDTIYLCEGDSIFIDHNGDFDLSGDPVPGTPPGVAYIFYDCLPTVAGDTWSNILANEPCLELGPGGQPVFAFGQPNGDIWFFNNGNLQTLNGGQPVLYHFAPATVDAFAVTNPYEQPAGGGPPGPCVNVNTSVAFQVVYLNAIVESGIVTNFGDDCIGKFRISGGYPQFMPGAKYSISISLASNPSIKAVIETPLTQMNNNVDVVFYAPQPGIYNVTVEDGKSCGHSFQIAMNGCDPSDNVSIAMPDTIAPPASQICVPINANGFVIIGASFNLAWDPNILQFNGVQNSHPAIGTFNAGNINTQNVNQGQLGAIIYDQDDPIGEVITIPDGEALFEVCFNVIGPLGSCSGLTVTNTPSQVKIEDPMGVTLPLSVDTGRVCVGFLPFQIAVEVVDPTCFGEASVKVTATGGLPGYDVVITELGGGPTTLGTIATPGGMFTKDNVMNGDVEVCVTDSNGFGMTICTTFTIAIPTLGVSLENTKRPTCFGDTDGIVTAIVSLNGVTVPNPSPPQYLFNWTPAPGPNGPVYSNVGSGSYNVTVTDVATGCTQTASGTLDQPSPLNDDSVVITPATCPGISNGGITFVVEGGTPFPNGEYQYNWEYLFNPNTGQVTQGPSGQTNMSTIVLSNLAGGTWYVTITDVNGCEFKDELDVPFQRNVELMQVSLNNTLCAGDSTGSICVEVIETPPSPNPTFAFFWSPIGFPQTTPGGDPLASCYENLPAGNYNVLTIDATGCSDTMSFTVGSPAPFVLDTFSFQQPNCTLQNNGAIEVIGTGGSGGLNTFTYVWSPGGEMTAKISNLFPGNYSVTAADANGCEDSLSFMLTLPDPPSITQVDSSSVKCGSDGSISVTSPTGVVYQWMTIDGQPVVGGDSSAIFNLQGDTFVVTIMDNQGCTTMDTFALAPVTPMSFSDTTFVEPSCFGYDDGSISIGVMNGNPNYTYLWSDSLSQSTPTMIEVPAGDYTVTVTDVEGCTLEGTFTLGQPPQIRIFFSEPDSTSCFGVCDGGIEAIVQYATVPPTFGDFNFVWSDGGTGDSIRNDLCADTISLIAIDANNCFALDTAIIPGPPEVGFDTLYTIPTTCFGRADGQAIVDGAGGNGGPYTYDWSPGGATTSIVNGLLADEYTVTITDRDGCTGVYVAEVTQPDSILVELDTDTSQDIVCFGDDTGVLAVIAMGGNPGGYSYIWQDSTGMVVGNTQVVDMLFSGVYAVTVTDAAGCSGQLQNLALYDPPRVDGDYLPWEELLCFGDETVLFIDTIFGGSGGPYKFSLDYGVTLDPGFPVSMSGGVHYITYFDRQFCEHTDTIVVAEPDPIVVTFTPAEVEIELGDSIQLKPLITGAVVDTFVWSPTSTLFDPNELTPFAYTFNNQTYTLTVFDANGCEGVGSISVTVDPNRNVYVPNVFWPGNPGGLNDHFNPQIGRGVERVNYMRIYDRWGALMYSREDFFPNNDNLAEGWDGKYKGDYVNPAVFVYVIEVVFLDGKVLTYRGDVTVVR